MREYKTELIVHVLKVIDYVIETAVHHRESPKRIWPDHERGRIQGEIDKTFPWLDELELGRTKNFCEQLKRDVAHLGIEATITKADCARSVLESELKQRRFFVLNTDNVRRFNNHTSAGEQIRDYWGGANQELIEAGNCFALGRYKSCAIHCCLACESGLIALGKRLHVPKQNDWGGWLSAIRNELRTRYTRRANRDRQFYAQCADRLDAIRIGRRNPASHYGLQLDPTYAEQDTREILDATCAFMRLLATKLKPPH